MAKSTAADANQKKSTIKVSKLESSLMAFAEEANLYIATKRFLEKGLGILLYVENPGRIKKDYFESVCFTPQYVKKSLENIECIMPMDEISSEILSNSNEGTKAPDDRYDKIKVFACEANEQLDRDGIAKLTRGFNRANSTENDKGSENCPVIVLIRQGRYLHISTCQRSNKNDNQDTIEDKAIILYKIEYANPRSGHLQILESLKKNIKKCDTFEVLFQKILDSLSVDIVSDNFFKGYKALYTDIIKYATGKKMMKDGNEYKEKTVGPPCAAIMSQFRSFNDPEKAVRDYVKLLMGRLVFIQFLQKKGWMGVPADDIRWETGDPDFIQNLFESTANKETFIDDVLIPLFKDLNTKRTGDQACECDCGNLKIPYLNGGLFDMDEFAKVKFALPSEMTKKLLDFFRSYNFTIDENSKDSVEVGVDPEMLSRIFENLLEDNKTKGAFYTPKEVVEYMCREALTTYLQTGANNDANKDAYQQFVANHTLDGLTDDDITYLDKKLREVKICDPAIGSGAFPMGMLKELFECRKVIEERLHENAINSSDLKKDIIQNSIYGVDIEKGAVNIARLRFWLALIIDEETPHALPNMDFKIMQGNSLLERYEGEDLSKLELTIQPVQNKKKGRKKQNNELQQKLALFEGDALENIQKSIKQYYLTDNHEAKLSLRDTINENVKWYIKHSKGLTPEILRRIDSLRIPNDQFFLWHIYFKEVFDQGGFDIVIGNPPYIELQDLEGMSAVYEQCQFETYNSSADIYCLFTEHGFNLLKQGGTLCYIMMNKWMKADYGKQLRNFVLKRKIHNIVDFGDIQIFKNATTYPCIILLGNDEPAVSFRASKLTNDDLNEARNLSNEFSTADFSDDIWVISSREELELYKKLKPKFPTLKNYLGYSSNYGIKTGLSDAFLITEETKNRIISESPSSIDHIIEPYFEGKDIKPYESSATSKYIILFKKGITYELMGRKNVTEDEAWNFISTRYPGISNWLLPFKNRARRRSDKGYFWWELRSCTYYDEFAKPKIMYQTFQVKPNFIYDTQGTLCNNSMWILPTEDKALLGLLNSKIGWWLISCYCSQIQNGYQLIWDYFSRIPIALQSDNKEISDIVDNILNDKAADKNADISDNLHKIDCLLYELYGLTNGEVKAIDPNTETFGADFEQYHRDPVFNKTPDEEVYRIYDDLRDRFEKILDVPRKKRDANQRDEYDLTKSTKPSKEELEDAFINWNCAILTAYRGKKQDINERRNQELKEKMQHEDLLFRSVDGYYIEYEDDGREIRTFPVNELSFFVTNTNTNGDVFLDKNTEREFFYTIYRYAEHYQQDSFLFTFPGLNRVAFLIATNAYGRKDFRNHIKFAGPLYKDVEDNAWTGCNNGKITFQLKGMIQKWVRPTKVMIGEGDIFEIEEDFKPDYTIILHDGENENLQKKCEEQSNDNLLVEKFDNKNPSEEEIQRKVKESLDTAPKSSKTIGFHCSAALNGSYVKGAEVAYKVVLEWAAQSNKNLNKIVIVDIFGDYCKIQ